MQESWRYLVHMSSYSPFLSQILFPLQRGSVGVKFDWQHLLTHSRKLPYRHKNLAHISRADRVITNFVPYFVPIAMKVGRGESAICCIQWPIPENPSIDVQILQISFTQNQL